MSRRLRVRLGLAVPLDGDMHTTWAFRLLCKVGLGYVARGLGIGCVSEEQLKKWAIDRERDAKACARELFNAVHDSSPPVAHGVLSRYPGVFAG